MDGTMASLKEKLDQLLREAAEVSVALDQADGTIQAVPHDSIIEACAHELGQQLSRRHHAGNSGENLALLRRLATSLLKQEKTSKDSLKTKRLRCDWDDGYLVVVEKRV